MKLIGFKYKDVGWELENLQLKDVNLLVGTNSSGKSRTLHFLSLVTDLILQKEDVKWNCEWQLVFQTNENQILKYCIETVEDNVSKIMFSDSALNKSIKEKISIDGDVVLERTNREKGKIKSFVIDEFEEVFPPPMKLVLHARRDTKHFPFLENIVNWAEQLQVFKFGNISSSSFFINDFRLISEFFYHLQPEKQLKIKEEINDLGYKIESFKSESILDMDQTYYRILIQEKGVERKMTFYDVSQGLARAFAILVFIENYLDKSLVSTFLIDDFCEGLDYSKATKLGKLIFDKCKDSNIQLIATSNDGFLMDTVDLKYWHVLKREGSVVRSISIDTHPEIFEKFKFTGLSNFDFFSSDFLEQHLNKV